MSVRETLEEFDFFDQAITDHGFTRYNRDYRLVAETYRATYTFMFRGCVEAHYQSEVVNGFSVDDVFIDYDRWEAAGAPEGFVWGVNWAAAYPGLRYVEDSPKAAAWQGKLGIPMHEVVIETNTYTLALVFHDVTVTVTEAAPT